MDLLSFIRSKLSKNNAFIGSLIIWSLFMPYYLFYLLNYDFDIDITWKHIFFIVSYYVLQICLMKTIPSDNLSISYIENSSYKNISINYAAAFLLMVSIALRMPSHKFISSKTSTTLPLSVKGLPCKTLMSFIMPFFTI